ncbi:unnamed protein product, partial [Mesorhabditis belari]|uniref:Uncharacterized protein n=1 Tax=Mesorhabditis belari TaxID=2138241 RepID=A0AAF3FA44_9BILA
MSITLLFLTSSIVHQALAGNCQAVPANVTWPPVQEAMENDYGGYRCPCCMLNCYFDGTKNQCYPTKDYEPFCPDLPATITWAPEGPAYYDAYGSVAGIKCDTGLHCYYDGSMNQCYMSEEAMADCPPLPASVTWPPNGEPRHEQYHDNKLMCSGGGSCYFDGTLNNCYYTEGECAPKPDYVTVSPTSRATVGRCPEDYACYRVGGVNECYCHDTTNKTDCYQHSLGADTPITCYHKRNQCARTCGWCI